MYDNNFNKRKVPSNVYPAHGGMNGNPFDRFNPLTPNSMAHMSNNNNFANFGKAYKEHDNIIEKMDYINKNHTLHNNINDTVLDEHIVEYRINIDSLDRDIKTYPDPFSFTVKFNPVSSGTVRTEVLDKGKFTVVNDYFHGAPGPHIAKEFRNVKYIKLDTAVLPQSKKFVLEDGKVTPDRDCMLLDDRFVVLVIKELDDATGTRIYSTSDDGIRIDDDNRTVTPPQPFGLIFPDKLVGRMFYLGTPYYSSRVFNSSQLGNIKQLTIQFYDSSGKLLKVDDIYSYQELKRYELENDPVPVSDPRHPLYKNFQVHLSFIIGVVEPQVSTVTKYEK